MVNHINIYLMWLKYFINVVITYGKFVVVGLVGEELEGLGGPGPGQTAAPEHHLVGLLLLPVAGVSVRATSAPHVPRN